MNKTMSNDPNQINKKTNRFFQDYIFQTIFEKFLSSKLSKNLNIVDKMRNISRLDGNSVIIPVNEVCDLINFTIYIENEQKINEELDKKEYKIGKFTEILSNGFDEENYQNDEITYENHEVTDFIIGCSSKLTSNVKQIDQNIIITF